MAAVRGGDVHDARCGDLCDGFVAGERAGERENRLSCPAGAGLLLSFGCGTTCQDRTACADF